LVRRTFDQVVSLRDVWKQFVEVYIAFAAGHSEAGDRHEVSCNIVHIVRLLVVAVIGSGGFTVLNDGWGSGTTTGSISRKFERGRELVMSADGGKGPVPSVTFLGNGVFKFFS
jgi:hypothetical protein